MMITAIKVYLIFVELGVLGLLSSIRGEGRPITTQWSTRGLIVYTVRHDDLRLPDSVRYADRP